MNRIPLIAGNWKMHKTAREAAVFIQALAPLIGNLKRRVFIAPPFTALEAAAQAARGTQIAIGAQNMYDLPEGAFTGEISSGMLKAAGACFVILGHSERRIYFRETNADINRKVKRALSEKLTPLLCIGETLEEREKGMTHQVLGKQLEECLKGISVEALAPLIIAYEPVWAIGTGRAATPKLANEAHRECRSLLTNKWGKAFSCQTSLLYGGSVSPDNIGALMEESDIDGVLVGRAALEVNTFAQLVRFLA
jgi:triosephosphate isomerase